MRLRVQDRLRYRAETAFVRFGTMGLVLALAAASLVTLAMGTGLALLIDARFAGETESASPEEAAWNSLTRLLDGGTFSQDQGWPTRLSMLLVTLCGLLIVSALIGVVTEGVRSKTSQWREGRSPIDESGHSLVLGWGNLLYSTVRQLCLAGANQSSNTIVVMCERPRIEMEALLATRVQDRCGARIVCRSGRPSDIDDLALVQAHHAKSVIVLPGDDGNDASTIKTVLAVAEEADRLGSDPHIIAPIFRQGLMPVARLAAPRHCQLVDVEQLICNLEAQASRSPGIGEVITQLLDFEGSEIYAIPVGSLAGRPMSEAVHGFDAACVIGVRDVEGRIELAPDPDHVLAADSLLLAVAVDDDPKCWGARSPARTRHVSSASAPATESVGEIPTPLANVRRVTILGWMNRGRDLVEAIEEFSFGGLVLTIIAAPEKVSRSRRELAGSTVGSIAWFEALDDDWEAAEDPICESDVVLVVADRGNDSEQADAAVLLNLLRLRYLRTKRNAAFRVVTELVDRRNQELAMSTDPDDLIVTGTLLSHALTQFIDNERGGEVLRALLEPGGVCIFALPLELLGIGAHSGKTSFETVAHAAIRRGCYAFGLRFAGMSDAGPGVATVLNPERDAMLSLTGEDRAIVIADRRIIERMFETSADRPGGTGAI